MGNEGLDNAESSTRDLANHRRRADDVRSPSQIRLLIRIAATQYTLLRFRKTGAEIFHVELSHLQ